MNKTWGQHWSTLAFGWSHRETGLVCSSRHPAYLASTSSPVSRASIGAGPAKPPFSCLTSSHSSWPLSPQVGCLPQARLLELNSSLEFQLHRLQFIRLLAGGPEKRRRPSAVPGTGPLLPCTSVVRAQVLGWPLQHTFLMLLCLTCYTACPPPLPPKKKIS